jgi:hypothetical protein
MADAVPIPTTNDSNGNGPYIMYGPLLYLALTGIIRTTRSLTAIYIAEIA